MKKVIKYSNNFVEAIYGLDMFAKKILLAVILNKNGSNKIEIHRSTFKEIVGIDPSQSHQTTQIAIRKLMTTIITIEDIGKKSNWHMYQLLKDTKYKDGVLYTSIYEDLLPFFDEAQERLFTTYNIQNIKPLRSEYSIKIYELLKQYEKISKRSFEVNELRKLLNCEKIYSRFNDFRKRVLDIAKKELTQKTDLRFDFEIEKLGKTPKFVHFKIWKNSNTELGKELIEQKQKSKEMKDTEKEIQKYVGVEIRVDQDNTIGKILEIFKDKEMYFIKADTEKGIATLKISLSVYATLDFLKNSRVV